MKRNKRYFGVVLCLFIMLISFSAVYADEFKDVDEMGNKVILVRNGIAEVLTFKEVEQLYPNKEIIVDNEMNEDDLKVVPFYTSWDKYIEKSYSEKLDYSQSMPVTPWSDGGEDGSTISYGVSKTVTTTFTGNITSGELGTILKSLGGSYARSASTTEVFSSAFVVGKNKIARVRFAPAIRTSRGVLQHWSQSENALQPVLRSEKNVTVYAVQKVGELADGIYYLEYKD